MVDSIGRFPVGRSNSIGRKRRNFVQRTIQKMEQWRDKARINLFQLRKKYARKVKINQDLMKAKKSGKLLNLNPSAISITGDKPRSRGYGLTHSTVPLKPKYSIVEPAERIYGNKWKTKKR